MAEQKETFKGFEIVIDDNDKLTIDGASIEVAQSDEGNYYTNYLPYTEYASLMELAKQTVDKAPGFDTISGGE
ncbi:MAG: hypothetical protein COB85_02350 [Bacteroidetes bacterium]|nr:MAG: hypothetical protein COB85_02350 [Bacteroidota bacterium]